MGLTNLNRVRELKSILSTLDQLEKALTAISKLFERCQHTPTREVVFILNQQRDMITFYKDIYTHMYKKMD